MSASELARKAGVPKQTIHDWLVGKKARDAAQVLSVCRVLGTSMEHLMFGIGDKAEERKTVELETLLGDGWVSGVFEIRMRRVRKN